MSLKSCAVTHIFVAKMQAQVMLERIPNEEKERAGKVHLRILDEACRILHGANLCSRCCATCEVASNIAGVTLPTETPVEAMNRSLAMLRMW